MPGGVGGAQSNRLPPVPISALSSEFPILVSGREPQLLVDSKKIYIIVNQDIFGALRKGVIFFIFNSHSNSFN